MGQTKLQSDQYPNSYLCQGRLTLESGVAISTTDQVDKTTLYFTPYMGDKLAIFNGTVWNTFTFAEMNLNISAFTASKPYDIFVYDNAGTPTLEGLVWTNGTTRATALALQNGIYCKTGALTRRYLGTIYMDAASKCQNTVTKRYVWNYCNRRIQKLEIRETTSHTYTTASWRAWNNTTAGSMVEVIIGVSEDVIPIVVMSRITFLTNAVPYVNAGLNSSTGATIIPENINLVTCANNATSVHTISGNAVPVAGYNYIALVEYGSATSASFTSATIVGDLLG